MIDHTIPTIFLTCSGVRGPRVANPDSAAAACGGGVDGLSAISDDLVTTYYRSSGDVLR